MQQFKERLLTAEAALTDELPHERLPCAFNGIRARALALVCVTC